MEAFVARQPIFDRERRVYGYELLFRSTLKNEFDGADATSSTAHLLGTSLMAITAVQISERGGRDGLQSEELAC